MHTQNYNNLREEIANEDYEFICSSDKIIYSSVHDTPLTTRPGELKGYEQSQHSYLHSTIFYLFHTDEIVNSNFWID